MYIFVSLVAFYFAFLPVFIYWSGHGIQFITLLEIEVRPQTLCCGC